MIKNSAAIAPTVNRISGFVIFMLTAMLAVFALVSVMLGIQIFNNIVGTTETNSAVRTSLSYVATKIRAGDSEGMVELRHFSGIDVIVLGRYEEDALFYNYIYYYDGTLLEYYASAETEFDPIYGFSSAIAEVPSFKVTRAAENLLLFSVTDEDGREHRLHVYVYSLQQERTEEAA